MRSSVSRTTMTTEPLRQVVDGVQRERRVPTVSAVLPDGSLLETVYEPEGPSTAFVLWKDGVWSREVNVAQGERRRLVPYSPQNNLIRNAVILFPSTTEEYGSERELVEAIQGFLHRYVDVSPLFEKLASYYVLLTWVYDAFSELPYLRVRGDPGSGKTRFLLVIGSVCYKPIFASGASTVSPLFRLLDAFRGTLIIDESDFRVSDERAEVVKILNNGNARGFPVLRSEVSGKKGEYNPRAYQVFGPKLVAARGFFDDRALESRFITEEMGERRLRDDIPINLPSTYEAEARSLRNKLLLFRFQHLRKCVPREDLVDRTIEPRLNQIFVPLLSVIEDEATRAELRGVARRYHRDLIADRAMETEAQVLEIVNELALASEEPSVSIKEVAAHFVERHGEDYERKITPKWIGTIVRRRLGLKAWKVHGTFMIRDTELAKLPRLREKYGLASPADPHPVAEETNPGHLDIG
jgi:hypothetical protein